jgi:hypothetical protein
MSASRVGPVVAAIAVGLAGIIHLALTDEHFGEGPLFGYAFLTMGIYQVVLAGLLIARPGPLAYKAGIWGSALIAATYVTTRVVPPPTAATPETITANGVAATSLELAALILLVLALPETKGRRWPVPAWLVGLLVGLATPPLWAFVTGMIQWTEPQESFRTPVLNVWGGPLQQLTPAIYGFLTDRLYLFLPWWAGVGAVTLGVLAGANVWLATRLRREQRISCRRHRASLLGLLPAAFAAPVCCSVPLAAIIGLSTATLFAAAPFATAAAIGILSGNLIWLVERRRHPARFDC